MSAPANNIKFIPEFNVGACDNVDDSYFHM